MGKTTEKDEDTKTGRIFCKQGREQEMLPKMLILYRLVVNKKWFSQMGKEFRSVASW